MIKVAIIGGLGAASTIAGAIVDAEKNYSSHYQFVGYINDKDDVREIQGYPVLGGLADIGSLIKNGIHVINTVYKIDGQVERVNLFESLNIPLSSLATFIHPTAYVAPNVELKPGSVVMPNANISSGVQMGVNCRVMSGAMVGHDNIIGDHCFFAANSTIGSHLTIGKAAYFGLNSTVGGKLSIGKYAVVGMGSVVTKDIQDFSIVAGIPAIHKRFVYDRPKVNNQ